MPTQIEKIQAHSEHLLDAFLMLLERYAILAPMLFDEEICRQHGSGKKARGFEILRKSLFISCAQDIANLTLDHFNNSLSIKNLVDQLQDSNLVDELREMYSVWRTPSYEYEKDPSIISALKKMEEREQKNRMIEFDRLYAEMNEKWVLLSECRSMNAFSTIRKKISSHIEVKYVADKYQFVDLGHLGLVWGDLKYAIEQMQRLIELLQLLIRNSGMAWGLEKERIYKAGKEFWTTI
jgi:hypothetical protein